MLDRRALREPVASSDALAVAALAATPLALFGEGLPEPLTIVGTLLGLVPWALATLGVRLPLGAFAAIGVLAGVLVVVVDTNPGGMFPLLLIVVVVTRSTDDAWIVGGIIVAAIAAIVAEAIIIESQKDAGLPYFIGGVGISALSGRMLRTQKRLVDELRAMQARASEHAAAAERTRIAREVHDVVAHSLTVVMLHLTGARRALASDPGRADEALARAESVGRESLDSIRQVVGLLRTGEDGERGPDEPLPGVGDLDALVERYRSGGLDVATDIALDGTDVDRAVQLVIYRVVQESLSNALQHAPGCACTVRVRSYVRRGVTSLPSVEVVVENTAPPVPVARPAADSVAERSGLGVRGMRERVAAAEGTFVAGERSSGGWRVVATMPLRLPVEPAQTRAPQTAP